MKKKLIFILSVILSFATPCLDVYAQADLMSIGSKDNEIAGRSDERSFVNLPDLRFTVVGGTGEPGTTGNSVPIFLDNRVLVSEIQFDLIDDPDFLIATGANTTSRTSGFDVSVTTEGRVSLSNTSNLLIIAGEGNIVEISYYVSPNAYKSEVDLKLQNVIAFDDNKQPITYISTTDGNFIIPNPIIAAIPTLGDGLGYPGTSNNPVPIILYNNVNVSRLQFEITDDPDFLVLTSAETTASTNDGFTTSIDTSNNFVELVGDPGKTIALGESTKILNLMFDVKEEAAQSEVTEDTLLIQNFKAYDADGQPIPYTQPDTSVFFIAQMLLIVNRGEGDPNTNGNKVPITLKNRIPVSEIYFNLKKKYEFLEASGINTTTRTQGFTATVFQKDTQIDSVSLFHEPIKFIENGEGPILEILYDVKPDANIPEDSLKLHNVQAKNGYGEIIPYIHTIDGVFTIPNPVPVELMSFSAEAFGNDVKLFWSTASESNNYGFKIERHEPETEFQSIAFVQGHGTTASRHDYEYADSGLSAGIYYYRLKQIDFNGQFEYSSVVEVSISEPLTYILKQNYPNPFNPETSIEYHLPEDSWITLKIYDLLGKEIMTLLDKKMKSGYHEITWSGRNNHNLSVAAGIYIYRMEVSNFSEPHRRFIDIKKMIYLK